MYERMSIDQYADYELDSGCRLYSADGVWWQEVRPFFFRPLFPFQRIKPGETGIPFYRRMIGYQHLCSDPQLANSRMNFVVLDRLQDYSVDCLTTKIRKALQIAQKNTEARPILDQSEFVSVAYPVYLSFYKRTRYPWRCDRTEKKVFEKWAAVLFRHPKIKIYGCYSISGLNTVMVSYLVETVIHYSMLFCNDEGLKLHTSDLMLHVVRDLASRTAGAELIFLGNAGSRKGLDDFKLRRQCTIRQEEAFYRLNPFTLFAVKHFSPANFKKLTGDLTYSERNRLKQHRSRQSARRRKGENPPTTAEVLYRKIKSKCVYGSK
jgi:hypothetical protein